MDDALRTVTATGRMGCRRGDRPRTPSTACGRSKPGRFQRCAPAAAKRPRGIEPPKGTPGEQALALAGQAATLDDLRAALAGFDGCALRDTASNLVFAEGDPASTTLIIGEPPGREEDRSGHPFAGPEGQLLDQMLASIRLTRAELMLTPLLPWRPPGGRPPSPGEIADLPAVPAPADRAAETPPNRAFRRHRGADIAAADPEPAAESARMGRTEHTRHARRATRVGPSGPRRNGQKSAPQAGRMGRVAFVAPRLGRGTNINVTCEFPASKSRNSLYYLKYRSYVPPTSGCVSRAGAASETACEGSVTRSPAFLPPGHCLPGLRS